jgi:hypothetical protein
MPSVRAATQANGTAFEEQPAHVFQAVRAGDELIEYIEDPDEAEFLASIIRGLEKYD